jgi:hypothetical protein
VDRAQVESILTSIEKSLTTGDPTDLARTGFWKAVAAVKRNPDWVDGLADRIGQIDRTLFERWALLKMPVAVGTPLALVATALGLWMIGRAYGASPMTQAILLLVGTVILMVSTHGLAHLAVGRFQGMRFSHWFVGTIRQPQPGVKVDYASYLRVPPARRAWMHAAGAMTTKFIPLIGLGAGWAMGAAAWAMVLLAVIAVGQVVIDVIWSTKSSDWKKFRREMALVLSAGWKSSIRHP